MTTGDAASDATVRGDGRTLAVPAFPDDDGRADPRLRDLFAKVEACLEENVLTLMAETPLRS